MYCRPGKRYLGAVPKAVHQSVFVSVRVIAVVVLLPLVLLASQKDEQPVTIQQIKEKYEAELMAIDDVVGAGIGQCDEQAYIKVYLQKPSPEAEKKIPKQLGGFKVETEISGPIKALPQERK